ncbi:hypothetical protein BKA93DRAFT_45437 [Sparassis latifolia]
MRRPHLLNVVSEPNFPHHGSQDTHPTCTNSICPSLIGPHEQKQYFGGGAERTSVGRQRQDRASCQDVPYPSSVVDVEMVDSSLTLRCRASLLRRSVLALICIKPEEMSLGVVNIRRVDVPAASSRHLKRLAIPAYRVHADSAHFRLVLPSLDPAQARWQTHSAFAGSAFPEDDGDAHQAVFAVAFRRFVESRHSLTISNFRRSESMRTVRRLNPLTHVVQDRLLEFSDIFLCCMSWSHGFCGPHEELLVSSRSTSSLDSKAPSVLV